MNDREVWEAFNRETRIRTGDFRYGKVVSFNSRGIADVEFNDGRRQEWAYSHLTTAPVPEAETTA